LPCIDAYARVDLRTRTYDVPPQELSIFLPTKTILCCALQNVKTWKFVLGHDTVMFHGELICISFSSLNFSQVLTKDSVTVSVDAVVYYRVSNATISIANVENAHHSTRLLAQTTLRNTMGTRQLHEILSERMTISGSMQVI
jgi:erythrocyte band 7 integral membrane protein